jgi:hypothetical protein
MENCEMTPKEAKAHHILQRARVEKAVAMLRTYNQWRRDETAHNPFRPSEIGEALDVVCGELEQQAEGKRSEARGRRSAKRSAKRTTSVLP